MKPSKYALARATFGLLVGASAVVCMANAAAARTRFDGLWSVSIVTQQGSCERGYRYPVAIVNGVVQHAGNEGDPSFAIVGRVVNSGAVRVSVRRGDQFAQGSGRLNVSAGEGRWVSPTSGCAGYWTAQRRGSPEYGQYPQYREQPAYGQYRGNQYRAYR